MPEFAQLESQDVREYWEDEARDFTPWLADQIRADDESELEDTLGLDLEVVEVEKSVGRYNVDILAQVVDDSRSVVIENQLTSSDHDHLGKSIAYASGVDADIIVWLAPQFYDEHQDAVQWLNENSREGVDLFAIRLEVWKIGESEPAVRFNPVNEPSEWKAKAQRASGELTETQQLQEEFWTQTRDLIRARDTNLSPRNPLPRHYYTMSLGDGFQIEFHAKHSPREVSCHLVVLDDVDTFETLRQERPSIESRFDSAVEFSGDAYAHDEGRVSVKIDDGDIFDHEDRWDEYHEWLIEQGERFYDVYDDLLKNPGTE